SKSSLDGARCEPRDDVALEEGDEEHYWKDLEADGCEQHSPADAVDGPEHLADHQWTGTGLRRREDEREGELVPGEDEHEYPDSHQSRRNERRDDEPQDL